MPDSFSGKISDFLIYSDYQLNANFTGEQYSSTRELKSFTKEL
jgi:hypothetical protein